MTANESGTQEVNAAEAFTSTVEHAFEWTVETDPSNALGSEHALRTSFYSDIYVPRENEEKAFSRFLHGEKNILVITGHVGIGKSTFLRYHMDHRRVCTGVIIDFNRWAERFSGADFGHALRATIARCFRLRLTENVAYAQKHNIKLEADINFSNAVIPAPYDPADNVAWERAQIELAALILESSRHISGGDIEALRQRHGAGVSLGSSEERIAQYRKSIIEKGHIVATEEIRQATRYTEWIRLYQILFKPRVPVIVAFDNADNLNLSAVKESLFEEVCKVHGEINLIEDAALITGMFPSNIRLVVSIRDENASLLRVSGQPASRTMQIALGMNDYNIPTVAENIELPTTKAFIADIVKRRYLRVASTKGIDQTRLAYFRALLNYWYTPDVETGTFEETVARISIIDLGNYSVRWVLDDIKYTCLYTLDTCLSAGIALAQLAKPGPNPWLRARIIRSLWARPSMQNFTRILQQDFRRKCTEPYLSRARLILTHLSCIAGWGEQLTTTSRGIHDALQYYFPEQTIEETREVLFALYISNIRQGELITIRQPSLIRSASEIADDAEVAIMPRGIEMLQRVLVNLDYFGGLLPALPLPPERQGARKVLAAMLPDEAAEYVQGIMEQLMRPIAKHFEQCWREQIMRRIDADSAVPPGTKYMTKFRRDMFAPERGDLYIVRVCGSHVDAIRNFIIHSLAGANSPQFLNPNGLAYLASLRKEVERTWPTRDAKVFAEFVERGTRENVDDDTVGRMLAGLAPQHPLVRLWECARELRGISAVFVKLCTLTKSTPVGRT